MDEPTIDSPQTEDQQGSEETHQFEEKPYDFGQLNASDLFEALHNSKFRLGFMARRLFCFIKQNIRSGSFKTVPKNHESVTVLCKLEKRKKDKERQKKIFEELCTEYDADGILSKCQDFCDKDWLENYAKTKEVKASTDNAVVAPEEDEQISTEDLTDSLMARVAHLSVEKDAASLFTIITSGPGERVMVDDKRLSNKELWKQLASEFYNNPNWVLYLYDDDVDSRCSQINPTICLSAEHAWSAEKLRQVHSALKSMYTKVYSKFKSSGHLECGGPIESADQIDADDCFFNKALRLVPKRAALLLYCHRLYGRNPPSNVLRVLSGKYQVEEGISPAGDNATDIVPPNSGKKRKHQDMSNLDNFADKLCRAMQPAIPDGIARKALRNQEKRDKSIANYFDSLGLMIKAEAAAKLASSNNCGKYRRLEQRLLERAVRTADVVEESSDSETSDSSSEEKQDNIRPPFTPMNTRK